MAIRTVITRGFGNGTFNGTIPLVAVRGYSVGVVTVPTVPGLEFTARRSRFGYTAQDDKQEYTAQRSRLGYIAQRDDR